MATSMLLQATPRILTEQKNQMSTMLQAPSIGGVRGFGAARRGYGVCSRRRAVLTGFRVQSGTKKVKKDESEDTQDTEPDVKMGTRKIRKLPGTMKLGKGKKDNNVVFVAGATGEVGRRVVRELVESGFQVRAGVRDISKGQALLEMLGETKSSDEAPKSWAAKLFKPRTPSKSERIELVECDLEKDDAIENLLGNAGVVVCAIGASEKEVLDTTGPYRIDFKATVNLVIAASIAKVNHFILVTSLGTTKFGWPASVLNLFWGVLIWKAKAEKALEESGLPYTIVRPGGMERPTDAYKETHNLVLSPKDTYSGGQVSSLQVAELIATCVSNLDLAKFKVLEAIAETTAPLRPIEDLLAEVPAVIDDDVEETRSSEPVPSPVRRNFKLFGQQEENSRKKAEADEKKKDTQESRKAAAVDEKRKIDLEEKSRKAAEADQKRKKELLARHERDLLAAREEEEEAQRKAEEALSLKAQLEKRTADLQVQARTAAREVKKAKALEIAIVTAARQGRRLSEKEKVEVLEAAAAEFDGESKSSTDTKKVTEAESKTSAASTNSKPDKGLKFKAMQAAKLKEADDRAAKKFAENTRIAEQAQAEKAEKERVKKEDMARLENETKAKAEAEAKAKAEAEVKAKAGADAKVKAEQEENDAKARADANAQAEKDRAIKDEAEAKAKEDAEATARSKQEALVDKAKKAKEEAATRAAIALEKAKGAAFLWPWQKRSIKDDEPLETPVLNKSLNEDEDAPLQVDSKPENEDAPLQVDSKPENEDAPSQVDSEPEASTS